MPDTALYKICESTILLLYGRIRVTENPYSHIFYAGQFLNHFIISIPLIRFRPMFAFKIPFPKIPCETLKNQRSYLRKPDRKMKWPEMG